MIDLQSVVSSPGLVGVWITVGACTQMTIYLEAARPYLLGLFVIAGLCIYSLVPEVTSGMTPVICYGG